jgi:hypothetical protein
MYEIPTINAGRYLISVPVFPYGFGSPTANLTAFDRATIYYPGTLAADDATVVEVGAGAEIDGIVVRLPALQTVAVSGRVQGLSLSGPANVELLFDETDRIVTATPVFVTRLASDGAFQFPRVPAGQYVVRVRHLARVVGSAGFQTVTQSISLGGGGAFGVGRGGPLAPMSDAPSYWATVPVAVGQTNVEGVEIVVRPGARIRGTVEFRGATPPEGDALNATGLMLTGGRMQDVPAFQVTRLETDGSFVTAGLPPGRYVPNFMPDIAGGMLRGWQLESITAGGRAVAAMELGTTDLQDVRLTFVDTPATVAGVVRDAAGSPVMGAFVHVFPVNRDVTPAFLGSVRTLSSSRRGAFEATLPSGEYFVVAALEPDADPDRAELELRATRVRLQLGVRQTIDLVAR